MMRLDNNGRELSLITIGGDVEMMLLVEKSSTEESVESSSD